jgi:hypothetical protein
MKTSYLLIVSLISVVALSACGSGPAPADQTSIPSQEPIKPAPAAEVKPPEPQFLVGQLGDIDMKGKKFVLKDVKGESHAFAYSETTEFTGGGGAKDLRGQEGRNATVRFLQTNGGKSAVQIHVEMGS